MRINRAAIGALLHDIDNLARDHIASVSYGFVRGDLLRACRGGGTLTDADEEGPHYRKSRNPSLRLMSDILRERGR